MTPTYGWATDSSWQQLAPTYGSTIESNQQQLSPSDTYLRLGHWQQPAAVITKWHLPTTASSSWQQVTLTYCWTIDSSSSCHHLTPTYGWTIDSWQQQLAPSDTYLRLDYWQQPAAAVTKWHLPTAGPLTAVSSSWHQLTPTYGWTIDSSQQQLSPSDTYLRLDHWQLPAAAGTKWHLPTAGPLTAASSSLEKLSTAPTKSCMLINMNHIDVLNRFKTCENRSVLIIPSPSITLTEKHSIAKFPPDRQLDILATAD